MRHLWRLWLCAQRREGGYSAQVVLVGAPDSVTHLARELGRMPEAGYRVLGACVPAGRQFDPPIGDGVPIVGDLDHLIEAVEALAADTVIITGSDELRRQRVRELSWKLEPGQQHLIVAPGPHRHRRPAHPHPSGRGVAARSRRDAAVPGGKLYGKRMFDVVASGALILLLAPLMIAVVAAIKVTDPGPALFAQRRVGKNGAAVPHAEVPHDGRGRRARLAELQAAGRCRQRHPVQDA